MSNRVRFVCFLVFAFLALVVLAGCGDSGSVSYDQTPSATLDRLVRGMQTESVGLVLSCYTNPYRLTGLGRSYLLTHEEAAALYQQVFARYNYSTWTIYYRYITVAGPSAAATCDVMVYNGRTWEYARFLYSLTRYGSMWLINHETLIGASASSSCAAQGLVENLLEQP